MCPNDNHGSVQKWVTPTMGSCGSGGFRMFYSGVLLHQKDSRKIPDKQGHLSHNQNLIIKWSIFELRRRPHPFMAGILPYYPPSNRAFLVADVGNSEFRPKPTPNPTPSHSTSPHQLHPTPTPPHSKRRRSAPAFGLLARGLSVSLQFSGR